MKSKLEIIEFRNRLKDNTKIGSPSLKIPLGFFSIFIHNPKSFYGRFDDSNFELTTNSNFFPTFYLLKGTYKNTGKNVLVNYSVEPAGKIRIAWIKYFQIFAIIIFNSIFYFEGNVPREIYIIANSAFVFSFFYSRLDLELKNKNMERKFNRIFEVIEDINTPANKC